MQEFTFFPSFRQVSMPLGQAFDTASVRKAS
jgi:hypothetical protein